MSSSGDVLRAYRNLYRAALQAVKYATPARYQLRDIFRNAFRHEPIEQFVPRRIQNTIIFLQKAKEYTGVEHKILKTILFTAFWRQAGLRNEKTPQWMKRNDNIARHLRRNAYAHLDATVAMLNESMDLCLRTSPNPMPNARIAEDEPPIHKTVQDSGAG